jgi:hypothetical protein
MNPVVLYIWSRPEKLQKVFNRVKEAKPSHLFLVSDGAVNNDPAQWELIYKSRQIVDHIDWECEVHRLYHENNNGLFEMFKIMSDYVFSKVDRYIFLEDDVVPSLSFFKYCEILLEKYKNDLRINMICGMNHLETYEKPSTDYFFTRSAASIWGFAIWKRTYEQFYKFDFTKDDYIFDTLIQNTHEFKSFQKSLYGYRSNERYNGHLAGPEFFLGLSSIAHNQLSIIPTKNMICNIGYGGGGRNFNNKKLLTWRIARLFDMKTYECSFPLKHPEYVIEDNRYKDLVLDALGRKNVLFENIERLFRLLIYVKIPGILGKKS